MATMNPQEALGEVKALNEQLRKGISLSPDGRKEMAKDFSDAFFEAQKALAPKGDDREKLDAKQIEEKVTAEVAKAKAELLRTQGGRFPHSGSMSSHMLYDEAIQADTKDEGILELQKSHDRMLFLRVIADTLRANGKRGFDAAKSKVARHLEEVRAAVYSTGTGTGDEWVPTVFSNMVQERVELATVIWQGLPQITIPQGQESITLPIPTSTRGSVYLQGQAATDNPAMYRATTPGTDNLVIAPITMASRNVLTFEMQEDSAVVVLDWMMSNMTQNFARALDDCCINGDTTAPHKDVDVVDPTDHRKGWDGFREVAEDCSSTLDIGAVATADVNSLRKLMGVYGINPAEVRLVCSMSGYIALLNLTETQTVDKFGPQATVVTGELGKINGIPIIVSAFMRDDLNATGVFDNSTKTKTGFTLHNVNGFARAVKRELSVQSAPDILTGITNIVGTQRVNLIKIRKGNGEVTAAYGFNHTA